MMKSFQEAKADKGEIQMGQFKRQTNLSVALLETEGIKTNCQLEREAQRLNTPERETNKEQVKLIKAIAKAGNNRQRERA